MGEPGGSVREALRSELASRRYSLAKDTPGSNGELYIWGKGQRAAALFEFKSSVDSGR